MSFENLFNAIRLLSEEVLPEKYSPIEFFENFDKESYALLLLGRDGKSIICRKPVLFIAGDTGQKTMLKTKGNEELFEISPFDISESILQQIDNFVLPLLGNSLDLSLFGYLGYESGAYYEKKLLSKKPKVYGMPDFLLALFSEIVIFQDGDKKQRPLVCQLEYVNKYGEVLEEVNSTFSKYFSISARAALNYTNYKFVQSHLKKEEYIKKIDLIKEKIIDGDIYQANFTQVLSAKYNDTGFDFFKKMYEVAPSNYYVYWKFMNINIISTSPELFLKTEVRQVEAQPIKGSITNSLVSAERQENIVKLLSSEKDESELSMIVDLFRNDFHRVCKTGSVAVSAHKEILESPHILHMYSSVIGELKEENSIIDIIKSCFPSGSITGCPKIRSVEVLRDLEDYRRGIYTGSIGYIGNKKSCLSVAIRTVLQQGDRLYFQVGGGIVYDSDAEKEYDECMQKARAFITALEMD